MKFQEKYISKKENTAKPDLSRTEISNEAFAIGEIIQALINKIESFNSTTK